MASAFNLTAEINLRGPSNLGKVVADIRRQLSTVTLDLNINPRSLSSIQQATGNIQSLNAALKSASTNAANLNTALSNLGTAIGNASRGMNNLGGGVNNIANQVNNARKSTAQITSQMEEFGKQSALAVRRFAAFSVATGGIYALSRAVASAYGEFLNFNKELVKLQQVTGATENGLRGITNEITRLSTSLGVTSSDLLTVSSTLAQAGLSATETKTALEALAKSALAPSFDNLNDTVEGSIALMRQFGISASDLESSLGSVNAVAAAFAVESGDIIKAIQRTGGVFASASKGVSQGKDALNEFIAVFTSVRQTTRESAETIATGLRTIFTRIQRGSTIEALKEYGVVLTDLEGKFVGPYEAIRRLSEGLKLLDPRDLRFNQIVEELGGFRQIGKVIPLIQQFTVAQQALGVAQRGAGSLAEDAAIAQISLANKITKVREEFIALIRDIGQSKNFQRFVDISLQLASALISVASAAKEVLPALAALTAIKAIPAIGQFVGGFGRNIARKNDGGPVRAFASGGYVPGSGNRDTVPAMLTPGEFVIRKKAVQAIGLSGLKSMNKYAGGGPVKLKDLEKRSGAETIRKAYSSKIQPNDSIRANINRKSEAVKPNDPKWTFIQNNAKQRYLQLKQKSPKASDKKLKDIAAGDAFETGVEKFYGGTRTPQSYPVDIIGRKNPTEVKFTSKKVSALDLLSKLFRYKYQQNSLSKYNFTPKTDDVNIGNLDTIEMGRGQKQKFMELYPFNSGGIVQKFKKGAKVQELSPQLRSQVEDAGSFENLINRNMIDRQGNYNFGLVSLKSGTSKGGRIENRPIKDTGKRARIHIGALSDNKSKYGEIEKDIVDSLEGVIVNTGKALASSIKATPASGNLEKNILSGAVLSSATGSIFEAALQMVGAPFIDKIESLKSIDFPFGLGASAKLFGQFPTDIPTDATRTSGGVGKGISDFVNQINRFTKAVNKGEFSKSIKLAPNAFTAQDLFSAAKKSPDNRTELNKVLTDFSLPNVGRKMPKATSDVLDNALATNSTLIERLKLKGLISANATGGSISGQDTVPALLTPGEFVINKKAARKIGSSKLHKLNNADKTQGFNKGGAVGNIQSFAGGGGVQSFAAGGMAQVFSGLVSVISKLIPSFNQLSTTTAAVTKNMAAQQVATFRQQGLSGGALKAAMVNAGYASGGINNMRSRNQKAANQAASQTANQTNDGSGGLKSLGLMFIGPMIAEAINSAVTKNFGKTGAVVGAGITSVVSGATVGSAFGAPGAIIGAAAGLASAFINAESAADAYTKAQNELKIETESSKLEKALQNLSQNVGDTASNISAASDALMGMMSSGAQNREIVTRESQGLLGLEEGTIGRFIGEFFRDASANFSETYFGTTPEAIDTTALNRNLLSESLPQATALQRTIETQLTSGISLEDVFKNLKLTGADADPETKRTLAIARGKDEVTKIEANIAAAEAKSYTGGDIRADGTVETAEEEKTRKLAALSAERATAIDRLSKAEIEEITNRNKNAVATKAVSVEIDRFAQQIKKLGGVISRAGAEFEEAGRLRDIATSAGLGDAKIVGPSRLDENVLGNLTAYSTDELVQALDRTSQTLGFSPEFSKQIKTSAVAQQTLESELPRILLEAAQSQKTPGGELDQSITDRITEVFDPLKAALGEEIDPGKLDTALSGVVTALGKAATSLQGKSFEEIAASVPELQGLLKPLADVTSTVESSLKAYNDMLSATNNEMNNYTNHLGRILDLQIQASSIELDAANNLKQALGKGVSVTELNRPFENVIDSLTSTQGPNGIVRGTGTLDPEEIARRLAQADKELAQTQAGGQQKGESLDEFETRLAKNKTTVDRLAKAQEMLANNTTRASNALTRIGELRQAQESRRGTFDEILKNLNNPEWISEFTSQVGSFVRVDQGAGTINDIGPALEAFRTRIAGMDPLEREAATEKFYNNIIDILQKAGLKIDPEVIRGLIGVGGPDAKMTQAIDQYNQAIQDQKDATLLLSGRMENSSEAFYNRVIQAADAFLNRMQNAGDLPLEARPVGVGIDGNPAAAAGYASRGGMIYASKGQLVNFQPRGTDTVPAMLTPGEFVVNARATKKNMGLLKSINNGSNNTGYSKGGMVYLADGGLIDPKLKSLISVLYDSPNSENMTEDDLYNKLKTEGIPLIADSADQDVLYNFKDSYEKRKREQEESVFQQQRAKEDEQRQSEIQTRRQMDAASMAATKADLDKTNMEAAEAKRTAAESGARLEELRKQEKERRDKAYESILSNANKTEEQKLADRRKKFPEIAWSGPKTEADLASIAAGTNPGVNKAQKLQDLFSTDPLFKEYRYNENLASTIKNKIAEQYSDDLDEQMPSMSSLLSLARTTSLDFAKQSRESAERKQLARQEQNRAMIAAATANFVNTLGDSKRYGSAFEATYLGNKSAQLHIKDAEKEGAELQKSVGEMVEKAKNYEGPLGMLAYTGDNIISGVTSTIGAPGGDERTVADIKDRMDKYKQKQIEAGNTDFSWENHTNPVIRALGTTGRYTGELYGGTVGSALNLIGGLGMLSGAGFSTMASDLGFDTQEYTKALEKKGFEALNASGSDFIRAMEQTGRGVGGLTELAMGYDDPTQLLKGKIEGQLLDERNIKESGELGPIVMVAQMARDTAGESLIPVPGLGKGASPRSIAGRMDDLDPAFTRQRGIPREGVDASLFDNTNVKFPKGSGSNIESRLTFGNAGDLLTQEQVNATMGHLKTLGGGIKTGAMTGKNLAISGGNKLVDIAKSTPKTLGNLGKDVLSDTMSFGRAGIDRLIGSSGATEQLLNIGKNVYNAGKKGLSDAVSLGMSGTDMLTGVSGSGQRLLDMGKDIVGKPFEMISNIMRNRSTKKWFENLQKQQKLSENPLEDLVKLGSEKKTKTTQPIPETPKPKDQIPEQTFKPQEEPLPFDLGDDVPDEVNKAWIDGKWVTVDEYSNILKAKELQQQTQNMKVMGYGVHGKSAPGIIAKTRELVAKAQEQVRDIMVRYSSSPEKAKEIIDNQKEIFNIRALDIDPNLKSKVNALTGKESGVAGEYRIGSGTIGIPSSEDIFKSGMIRHEIGHGVQANLGMMQSKTKGKYFGEDSLKTLQPQIDEFTKPGGAYEKLIKDLRGGVDGVGFYEPGKVSKNHSELFTSLIQGANTEAFEKNKEAQDMLRAVIKAMGYRKGGTVYASNGTLVPYQPRGTDTVPAMLTPGEFVVNARATKNNLGLLRSINGGAKGYSKGGVAYLQDGGNVQKPEQKDGDGLLGMRHLGEGMDLLYASSLSNKNLTPEQFEYAAKEIETGLGWIKGQSELSPNTIDNQAVMDFETAIMSLIQSSGEEISKMSNIEFDAWRTPYNDAYNKLKQSLQNRQGPPTYILDDMVSLFDNQTPTPTQQPASKAELAAIGSFVGGGLGQLGLQQPAAPVYGPALPPVSPASVSTVSEKDPYAGMSIYDKEMAIRKQNYQDEKARRREEFRSRTGRDPKTGRIGGERAPLTQEQKDANRRRAEIRATKTALGDITKWEGLKKEEQNRLLKAEADFEKNLSPEQIKNRKRAERMSSMSRGIGEFSGDTEEDKRLGRVNKPYGAPARAAEFVSELSPEQKAKREEIEKTSLINIDPDNRTQEQIEKLDLLKIPIDQRTPEQIARLEELRRKREEAIYASKGRLINYQPRGTDTVPAMLTPGEFVVNRKATKQNLGLLQQINSQNYNTGGLVKPKYFADGGVNGGNISSSGGSSGGVLSVDSSDLDSSFSSFDSIVGQLTGSIQEFISGGSAIISGFSELNSIVSGFTALSTAAALLGGASTGLSTSIGEFNTAVGRLQSSLSSIPDSINLNVTGSIPVNVTVTVNGGQGLGEKLEQFADDIYNTISTELSNKTNGGIKLDLRTSKK